jgi:hypothetical protein
MLIEQHRMTSVIGKIVLYLFYKSKFVYSIKIQNKIEIKIAEIIN